MHFILTMDQVRKLYEELAQYDPSLQNDKEAVLQVIEKMLAAKPMIVADPQRKDRFGEQLTEHIAKRKMLLPAKTGFSFRVAKRGFSFATFFLVMLVAGGAYIVLRMDVISNKKNIGLKNHAQIKTDAQDSNVAIDAQVDNQVAV